MFDHFGFEHYLIYDISVWEYDENGLTTNKWQFWNKSFAFTNGKSLEYSKLRVALQTFLLMLISICVGVCLGLSK